MIIKFKRYINYRDWIPLVYFYKNQAGQFAKKIINNFKFIIHINFKRNHRFWSYTNPYDNEYSFKLPIFYKIKISVPYFYGVRISKIYMKRGLSALIYLQSPVNVQIF